MNLSLELNQLRQSFEQSPYPTVSSRRILLLALKRQLLLQQQNLYQAASADFGQRSASETRILEVLPCINSIEYSLRQLKRWTKPQKRHTSILFQPAKNYVFYQPLGVVGIIVPWNYPIFLALGPLVAAISAGNKIMLKLSESTPQINKVLKNIIETALPDTAVVIEGAADIAAAFSALPFDHLLYTGSTAIGHHVMHAASAHLTPVTLELGGKSPVIVAPDAAIENMADRIIFGKCANGGQTCVAPDYLLVHQSQLEQLVQQLQLSFNRFYPNGHLDANWTQIINERQAQRLQRVLQAAEAAGAQVISCQPVINATPRQMTLQLVLNAPADCQLMQDEIFGPILPIVTYQHFDEAIAYIQQRPRPLAVYLFSQDKQLQQRVLKEVHAGGVCLNDTLVHVGQDDLPFGGIGPSGMGAYHGHEGFLTFSHAKAVHQKGHFSSGFFAYPHFRGKLLDKLLNWLLRP